METIIISGVDGSGKSTIAKALRKYLEDRCGLRTSIVWFRWRAFLMYMLYLYIDVRRLYRYAYNPRLGKYFKINRWSEDPFLRTFYPLIQLFDMIIFYILIKAKLLVKRSQVLIFDRFLVDMLVDIVFEARRPELINSALARIVYSVTRKAGKPVFLDVAAEIAYERKKDILSIEEIRYKQALYRIIAKLVGAEVIDTSSNSIAETLNLMLSKLNLKSCRR